MPEALWDFSTQLSRSPPCKVDKVFRQQGQQGMDPVTKVCIRISLYFLTLLHVSLSDFFAFFAWLLPALAFQKEPSPEKELQTWNFWHIFHHFQWTLLVSLWGKSAQNSCKGQLPKWPKRLLAFEKKTGSLDLPKQFLYQERNHNLLLLSVRFQDVLGGYPYCFLSSLHWLDSQWPLPSPHCRRLRLRYAEICREAV